MEEGEIEIDFLEPISLQDITQDLAVESGFLSKTDLLRVAKHGSGSNVYLVRFHYVLPTGHARATTRKVFEGRART